ncbi:MAG: hypothetical protein UY47_C0001G0060 [Parcubacteria group bacterium GW2011_GWB1_49_7]|uniref:Uncharacterized protein n=2 Tax=Candidatus Zambryskiibacteriota TaxID=1817925 RepID=A0A1G2SZX6_9BACT|nr:MAG: hypothetical protein UY47_C0001G0060 [Parcubacteria group bacterium GW2011_GWB1_49_7]OHA90412.1 MAG: hypothetical protein A2838_02360 [Candidatus Zambryskibacteria bacterium RIFCSPHIGHO2_01_FULL_46_25]OHA96927.1 MAG: hypothetical protein A3D49_02370 [Candidatus Zambryskibacteria bacterium RIFCSPHIGHO2_02_FULL_43_37]OHB02193.1 MAG: hypothetical protein A3F53_01170 [Candidatus Zambryskibacteria bacterium RIFCSPHIGHO2_12_FULL_48_10]OHB06950.1 MAG: hypothetical protein A3A31_01495 [Candidat
MINKRRYITLAALILAIIFLPYYVYIPFLAVVIVVFPFFWEGVFAGFLIDALYGSEIHSFFSIFSTFAFFSLSLAVIILPIRRRIRAYA